MVLLLGSVGCSEPGDRAPSASAEEGDNHPLVVKLFDACKKGDVGTIEETLATESLAQLDRLFALSGNTRKARLSKVAGVLARVPVPHCKSGDMSEHGYQLDCHNLGQSLELEVIVEQTRETILLPEVPSDLWRRLDSGRNNL